MATAKSVIAMQEVARKTFSDAKGTYALILSREVVSQNIAENYSNVVLQVSLYCSVWISATNMNLTLTDSTGLNVIIEDIPKSYSAGTHVLWRNEGGWNLGHSPEGVLDYTFSAKLYSTYLLNGTVSGKITAPNIPRYTTAYQSVKSITETSIAMNWLADDTVDYIWYSINNGSSWTGIDVTDGTSGTYTISGLSPNTTYNIKTRVRRKDSQLTTDTSALPVTTYKVPTQSLKSKTETSITMNWACDTTADHIWYSKDNGANWIAVGTVNATSGSYTISGLSPSTTYNIKTRIRRKATQTTYDTSSLKVNTYDYPHITAVETSNLIIGNSQKLTIYNPLSRNVTIKMLKDSASGTQLYSGTTTSTSFTFTPNANTLYNSIPNSKSSNCVYSCICDTVTKTTQNRTYAINENNCKPTFTNFTYADTGNLTSNYNGTVINTGNKISQLTGNDQLLVNGYSTCKFVISTTNKAIAKNGSSIIKYKFEWGVKSEEVEYSSNQEVNSFISYSTGNTLKVTAIDSRGLTTTVTKTVPVISYVNAKINEVTTQRKNGVNVETYLAFKATIWNGNWNNSSNSNYANQLKYVGYRVYNGSTWTGYFDITPEVKELMTTSTSGNSTTITLSISKQLPIHANGTSDGFEIGKQYTIQLLIRDGTSSYTFTSYNYQATLQGTVTDGKVGMSRYKDSSGDYHYAINQMPEDNYALSVNGNIKAETKRYGKPMLEVSDTYQKIALIIGESGVSRGIYDVRLDKLLWYYDDDKLITNGDSKINGYLSISGRISSSLNTGTHLNGAKGEAIINSTVKNPYVMLARLLSTNGVFNLGVHNNEFDLFYIANSLINAGTNSITHKVILLNEDGNTRFPGTVYATEFNGLCTLAKETKGIKSNPTIATVYLIPFMNYVTDNEKNLTTRYNDGLKYHTLEGTASAYGTSRLILGNSTASGTAGNKEGQLAMYSSASNYTILRVSADSANRTLYLPAFDGTLQVRPNSLYNNTTGSTGTITLSQSAANFSYLEIFYGKDAQQCQRIYNPNGKSCRLVEATYASTVFQTVSKNINISGTSITVSNYGYGNIYSAKTCEIASENNVKIYKVNGYK